MRSLDFPFGRHPMKCFHGFVRNKSRCVKRPSLEDTPHQTGQPFQAGNRDPGGMDTVTVDFRWKLSHSVRVKKKTVDLVPARKGPEHPVGPDAIPVPQRIGHEGAKKRYLHVLPLLPGIFHISRAITAHGRVHKRTGTVDMKDGNHDAGKASQARPVFSAIQVRPLT